jgi:hypothetical protein
MRISLLSHITASSAAGVLSDEQNAKRDACVARFWRCVFDMTREQRQKLLKFITGCSRPPLMGFKVCLLRGD